MNEVNEDIDFNPYVLELEKPISIGKKEIAELRLREPTCGDMRNLKLNGDMSFGDLLDIGQKLCETNRRTIDALCKSDAIALVERVGFLLEDGA